MKLPTQALLASVLALSVAACDSTDAPSPDTAEDTVMETGIAVTEWQQQSRDEFASASSSWQQALEKLAQTPSDATLAAVRESLSNWYQGFIAQTLLLQARACQLDQHSTLARMDSWPLYPGYIDAMPEWPESGLISDPYLDLDRKTLRIQHGATDAAEASLGFAAMFVVLNGTGTALKPLSHFQDEALQAPRRLTYLKLAGEQLVADYQTLTPEAPLQASDLNCGLAAIIDQHRQLAEASASDSELVTPERLREILDSQLLAALKSLPEAVGNSWNQSDAGILDALAATSNDDWSTLTDWQSQHAE